jgi:hypothetical protein
MNKRGDEAMGEGAAGGEATGNSMPIDFSAIDPTLPPEAFEARLATVAVATRAAMARRVVARTPLGFLTRWQLPLMAAMLLVMLASAVMVRIAQGDATTELTTNDEVADALGLSTPAGSALLTGNTTSTDLLLGGFEQ